MTPLPRPRCAQGERMILHAEGDPWNGCVVRIVAFQTASLVRCRLPKSQRPLAKRHRGYARILSTSDLF